MHDETALDTIDRFGWLTAYQLGSILFPYYSILSKTTAGNREIVSLLKRGLISMRVLKIKKGKVLRAYVLTSKGAEYLEEMTGRTVISGEYLGKFSDSNHQTKIGSKKYSTWTAPEESIEHALLVQGYLALLIGLKHEVVTSRELRRIKGLKKIPDGLVKFGVDWFALEMERAEKLGGRLSALAVSMIEYQNKVTMVDDRHVRGVVIAFDQVQVEEGRQVNHPHNIIRALNEHLKPGQAVSVKWAELTVSDGKVEGVTHKDERISCALAKELGLNHTHSNVGETFDWDSEMVGLNCLKHISELRQDFQKEWKPVGDGLWLDILGGIISADITKDFKYPNKKPSAIRCWVGARICFNVGLIEDYPPLFRKNHKNQVASAFEFSINYEEDDEAGAKREVIEKILNCIPVLHLAWYRQTGFLIPFQKEGNGCIFWDHEYRCERYDLNDECSCFHGARSNRPFF